MDSSRIKFGGSIGRLVEFKKNLETILSDIELENQAEFQDEDLGEETTKEKRQLILDTFTDLESRIRDAQIFKSVCEMFSCMEAEIVRASTQINLLINENNWLQQEMSDLKRKLDNYEGLLADEQANSMHLQFLLNMKQPLAPTAGDTSGGTLSSSGMTGGDRNLTAEEPNSDQNSSQSLMNTNSMGSRESLSGLSANSDFIIQNIGKELSSGSDANLPSTIKAIQDLVYQYISERQLNQAIPLIKESIDAIEKNVNTRVNTDIATLLSLLALVYKEQMNFDAARDTLNEVLRIMEQIYDTKHPMVAAVLNNLSVLYGQRKQFVQAEILCRRALNIRREHFGSNHSDVAKQLTNLAILCQNQYKYTEAREYMDEALKIYTSLFNDRHPEVLKVKTNIAINLLKQRNYNESEQMFVEVARTYYRILSSTDTPVSTNSGNDSANDSNQSHEEYKRLMDTDDSKKIFENAAVTAFWSILKNMMVLYKKNNKFDKVKMLSSFISNLQSVSDRESFLTVCRTYPIFAKI